MAKKELWLKNNKEADVHISDLGVKVKSLKTINVYAYNPYITEDKVKLSKESGALAKRLNSGTLSIVKKPINARPHTLDHIKSSTKPVEIVKTKTSIVIDTKEIDVLDDDDLGEIADYGLGELGHENTKNVKDVPGSVVVQQKQDKDEEPEPAVKVKMETIPSTNASTQSIVAVTDMAEKATNPVGDVVENAAPDQSFIVVKPTDDKGLAPVLETPTDMVVKPTEDKKIVPVVETPTESITKVSKDESNAVVVTGVDDGKEKAASSEYDAHVATRDESGAIVMKLKEVEEEDTKPAKTKKKAKSVKVTKKKTKK